MPQERGPRDVDGWRPAVRNVGALLRARARERGDRPCLTFHDERGGERTELGYATLFNWVSKTSNLLTEELGVGRGDRVGLDTGDHWTTAVLASACWQVGAAAVPGPPGRDWPPVAVVFAREDRLPPAGFPAPAVAVGTGMGARLTTHPGDALPYAEEVLAFADDYDDEDVSLDDDALVVPPVRLSQGNLLAAAEALVAWGDLGPEDRLLAAVPTMGVQALALGWLGPVAAGASAVTVRHPSPAGLRRLADRERVTTTLLGAAGASELSVPPPGALCAERGAARLPRRDGLSVGHGLVEATVASSFVPRDLDDATGRWLSSAPTVGCAAAHARLAAVGPDGGELGDGRPGELAVRGPMVMTGYLGDDDASAAALAHGWLHSGDRGFTATGPDGRRYGFLGAG
ncbi:MAG: AMP-binding protein [Actinobacteria bacterium]|nr:AMP-binding protein [Actinomycetota bacterium]